MGFLKAFKNIILGKPVFEAGPQKPGTPSPQSMPKGPKVIPHMYVERTNCHTAGEEMRVEVVIQNYSQQELWLDRIEMLGRVTRLNNKQISPGEEDELTAYEGHRPRHSNDTQLLLHYKDVSGDYFCSMHNVEYQQLPDSTYMVRTARFMHIKDE